MDNLSLAPRGYNAYLEGRMKVEEKMVVQVMVVMEVVEVVVDLSTLDHGALMQIWILAL